MQVWLSVKGGREASYLSSERLCDSPVVAYQGWNMWMGDNLCGRA